MNESIVRAAPSIPPQGILKKTIDLVNVPLSDMYTSRTPSVLSEAEGSEDQDLDGEKMIVEDEDTPGRLIRFKDPPREELNASVISASDAESSIFSTKNEPLVSSEPSDFMKKLEELKSIPLLDPFVSDDQRFRNTSQRRAILNLTREPLKIHSRDASDARLPAPESTSSNLSESAMIIDSSNFSSATAHSLSQLNATASSEHVIDISEIDKNPNEVETVSAREDVPMQEKSVSIKPQPTKGTLPCTLPPGFDPEAGWRPILQLSSRESLHSKSGSSSGNSSYNSASERSLHITPRRPLRDSRNASTSDLSIVSAGDKNDDTMNGSNIEKCEEDDADICIVDSVILPSKETEPVQIKTAKSEVYSVTESPVLSKLSMPSVKDLIDEQIERSIAAEYKDDVSNVSSDIVCIQSIEHITDSEEQNHTSETDKPNYNIDSEFSEDIVSRTNKSISPEIAKSDFTQCVVSECDRVNESSMAVQESIAEIKVYDFTEDIPEASLPAYVPIKERINRSYMSKSENVGDFNDISFSSCSSKDQTERPDQDQTFKVDNADFESLKFAIKSSVQILESDSESCGLAEEGKPQEKMSLEDETAASTPAQNFFQSVSDRFDFISKNSAVYENTKLYKKAMNLLQGNDITDNYELYSGRKTTAKKSRTFVFTKSKVESLPKIEETTMKSEDSNSKTGDETSEKKGFLDSLNAESYAQFSIFFQRDSSDADKIKNLKSSPSSDKGFASMFSETCVSEQPASESKGKKKKQESTKKDSSLIRKVKSSIKKTKEKGKVVKKMEFSFAEPHSPADPEILEALTTTPENPIGSFMFSPPLTRGRLRQKRLDETMGSSFASVMSDTSFSAKKPPVDPILEEIMAERAAKPEKLNYSALKSRSKSSTKKKSSARNPNSTLPHSESMDTSHNLSRLQMDEDLNVSAGTVLSSMKFTPKHKMVLRQTKTKKEPRKEPLF